MRVSINYLDIYKQTNMRDERYSGAASIVTIIIILLCLRLHLTIKYIYTVVNELSKRIWGSV